VALEEFNYPVNRLAFESKYLGFSKGLYRAERLGMPGSSKTVTFWVYEAHTTEAAQAMAWEMLLDDVENGLQRSTRREVRFP
jgi:hypothetical protein